jgi:hypothetical protein
MAGMDKHEATKKKRRQAHPCRWDTFYPIRQAPPGRLHTNRTPTDSPCKGLHNDVRFEGSGQGEAEIQPKEWSMEHCSNTVGTLQVGYVLPH